MVEGGATEEMAVFCPWMAAFPRIKQSTAAFFSASVNSPLDLKRS
jgi:hypothetical protein